MLFNFNEKLESWLVILNNNAKWAVALVIRFLIIATTLILFVYILKWTGILSGFKNISSNRIMIENKEMDNLSKPSTPTYDSDIEKIKNIQDLIANRIKTSNK